MITKPEKLRPNWTRNGEQNNQPNTNLQTGPVLGGQVREAAAPLVGVRCSAMFCRAFGCIYSETAVNVLASRSICHRPSRFSKIESECPAILEAGSPFLGVITRVDSIHM